MDTTPLAIPLGLSIYDKRGLVSHLEYLIQGARKVINVHSGIRYKQADKERSDRARKVLERLETFGKWLEKYAKGSNYTEKVIKCRAQLSNIVGTMAPVTKRKREGEDDRMRD
uniref:Uncharacterized protein n=1 Tax=Palpitomonas bilix TaxID=652834 RepID=A0A7S3D7A2_9EUKA